jgi:hypothetical protein
MPQEKYLAWVADHAARWDQPPRQKYHRCLANLLALIVRTIDGRHAGELDVTALSVKEVRAFREQCERQRSLAKRQ